MRILPSAVFTATVSTLLGATATGFAAEPPITGPARVIDGDTLEVAGERVRLFGVDAPEREDPRGPRATAALVDLVDGRQVTCTPTGDTSYGRIVARCRAGGRDLGDALIRDGWAFAWRAYTDEYDAAEAEARKEGRGFWKDAPNANDEKHWLDYVAAFGPTVGAIIGFLALVRSVRVAARLQREQRDREHRQELERQDRLRAQESKAIASALFGEVHSTLDTLHLRQYEHAFQRAAQLWREAKQRTEPDQPPLSEKPGWPALPVLGDRVTVFEATAPKLGLLPAHLPQSVVHFNILLRSIKQDLQSIEEGLWEAAPPDKKAQFANQVAMLLRAIRMNGQELCLDLAQEAGVTNLKAVKRHFAEVNRHYVDPEATEAHPDRASSPEPSPELTA